MNQPGLFDPPQTGPAPKCPECRLHMTPIEALWRCPFCLRTYRWRP